MNRESTVSLFRVLCGFGLVIAIFVSLLSMGINQTFISFIVGIITIALWFPKFYNKIINKYFFEKEFKYFFFALVLSFILVATQLSIYEYNYEKEKITNIGTNKNISTQMQTQQSKYSLSDKLAVAQVQCKNAIKEKAIYPPSIKIRFRQDNYINGNNYTLYGSVDGQNTYGRTVRQNFACEVIIDEKNDKIWVSDLNID